MNIKERLNEVNEALLIGKQDKKYISYSMCPEFTASICNELNSILKEVKTWEQLQLFETFLRKNVLTLQTKRLKRTAYAFSQVRDYWGVLLDRVHYLLDDGMSTRRSNIRNLYKNLIVTD